MRPLCSEDGRAGLQSRAFSAALPTISMTGREGWWKTTSTTAVTVEPGLRPLGDLPSGHFIMYMFSSQPAS